jgi:restriction endonuclease S subunit
LDVFIDGEMVAQVDFNGSERIIIPNGDHSIMVCSTGIYGVYTSDTIVFTANSKRILFHLLISKTRPYTAKFVKEGEVDLASGTGSAPMTP